MATMFNMVDIATHKPTMAKIIMVMRLKRALPALHPAGHVAGEDIDGLRLHTNVLGGGSLEVSGKVRTRFVVCPRVIAQVLSSKIESEDTMESLMDAVDTSIGSTERRYATTASLSLLKCEINFGGNRNVRRFVTFFSFASSSNLARVKTSARYLLMRITNGAKLDTSRISNSDRTALALARSLS
jgi:hypothetical protein